MYDGLVHITLMRLVDRALGIPAAGILSAFRPGIRPDRLRRALVIKLFGLGNIVMLAPAVQVLKSAFPGLEVDLLTFAPNGGAARLYGRLFARAHLLHYSAASVVPELAAFVLRHRGAYDLVFDAEQFIRLAVMVALALRPLLCAGLPTPGCRKGRMYDVRVVCREDRPLPLEYLDLARAVAETLGRTVEIPTSLVEPEADPEAARRAERFLGPLPPGIFRVAVCVGGRKDALIKRYPSGHWRRLLSRLVEVDPRIHFIFTGTSGEVDEVRAAAEGVPHVLDLSGRLNLQELVEVLRRVDLVLSNDTGTIHLAAATGRWCVGFYGPTDPAVYGPFTPRRLILRDPRNIDQITNRREKSSEGAPVYWVSPEEALERIRPLLTGCL